MLGYLHFGEGGFTGPSAEAHRLWGTVTAVAAVAGWWLASRSAGRAGAVRLAAGIAMLVLVSITGHYGGNLTHGTTFLGEYAPSFLRSLIGAAPPRPPATSVAAADPYLDVVQPLLSSAAARATTTTNATAASASRAMTRRSSAATRAARSCPATSKRASSIYRTGLPPDDEAFMPAEGKTPLTAEQVEILRWWVGAGAPHDTTVGAIGAPGTIEPLLAAQLGLGGAAATAASAG